MSQTKQVYHFRVTLKTIVDDKRGEQSYREITILSSHSLSTLAQVIVRSFGFDFDHCYGYYDHLNDPNRAKEIYELFTDLGEDPTPGAFGVTYIKVSKAFDRVGKKMLFLFDYGDNWQFIVELIDIKPLEKKAAYPNILKKVGKAPEQYPELDEQEEYEEEN